MSIGSAVRVSVLNYKGVWMNIGSAGAGLFSW